MSAIFHLVFDKKQNICKKLEKNTNSQCGHRKILKKPLNG